MISLKPYSISPEDCFDECIKRPNDAALEKRLKRLRTDVQRASNRFDINMQQSPPCLTLKPPVWPHKRPSKKEMINVYDYGMVQGKGRIIYDKIKLSAPHNVCPYCGSREATTLDHYLPKSDYPLLAVTPLNLVPACKECNTIKHAISPERLEELTIHPYFETYDLINDRWLQAKVVEVDQAVVVFSVMCPAGWDQTLFERLKNQFNAFNLGNHYAFKANGEMLSSLCQHKQIAQDGSPQDLKDYLESRSASAACYHVNNWRVAFYEALAVSKWYCEDYCLTK